MPKQKGLYQLQGKAQGMCYYSQAGVKLPLMRTINQGMSERVKTSDEFENTRKNNWEFALANSMATSLYNFIYPNWRSMFRRFTIPYMTARLLEEIKNGTGDWGERHLDKSIADVFTSLINHYAKARTYQGQFGDFNVGTGYFLGTELSSFAYPLIQLIIERSTIQQLIAKGIDGIEIYFRYLVGVNEYYYGSLLTQPIQMGSNFNPSATNMTFSAPTLIGDEFGTRIDELYRSLTQTTSGILASAVLCPYHLSGDKHVILQKQCTYVVFGRDPKPQTQS